ncbi:response regulator [Oceanicaulis sp. LC35]|uniref:response regulator n=1 Tax=Oceanicaulis sp. LC35 TaxID=3349635 RepID=UPI003F8494E8
MTQYTPRLLLVEDDPQDAFIVQRYLSDLPYGGRVDRVDSLLNARAQLGQSTDIACVMVDLKLADGSGASLIEWMLSEPELSEIPVIVFSGDRSTHPELDTFTNVACLIQKPATADGYEALSKALRPIVESALARAVYAAQ